MFPILPFKLPIFTLSSIIINYVIILSKQIHHISKYIAYTNTYSQWIVDWSNIQMAGHLTQEDDDNHK